MLGRVLADATFFSLYCISGLLGVILAKLSDKNVISLIVIVFLALLAARRWHRIERREDILAIQRENQNQSK